MNIIIEHPKSPPKMLEPSHESSVSITFGTAKGGRLPVTVTVVPLTDLDAKGGVFVDFRQGILKAAAELATEVIEEEAAVAMEPDDHPVSIAQGDRSIAALAAREAAAEALAVRTTTPDLAKVPEAAAGPAPEVAVPGGAAKGDGHKAERGTKRRLLSHQIGQALKLTTGQAESFRAEVALPPQPAEGEGGWYVRGRIGTDGGKDLRSEWLRI